MMIQRDPTPRVPAITARGVNGAVVSPHALASGAGLAILRAGGSAVDAAIATNAALSVVTSYMCGLGGDAFWLIWPGDAGEAALHALNGSGRSAAGATIEAAHAAGLDRMPVRGPWTVTVPGAVRSWGDAHARFGRLAWADLFGPAIELAAGFPASAGWVGAIERSAAVFGTAGDWASVFRPLGRAWLTGERVVLAPLGRTLAMLAAEGPDLLYRGVIADRAANHLASAGCPIRPADLASHASTWAEPIRISYRGVEVNAHPPNSSGAIALELLGVLGQFTAPEPTSFGPTGMRDARWVHRALEAARLALADRDVWLTDPDAMAPGALETLLDPDHWASLAARIDPSRTLAVRTLDAPAGGGTVYLATADRWGGAVSLIESNYAGFGSGIVDPETGIAYQNRGSFFSLDPGHANALRPGKRTMHTLAPGMLFRDGRPWIVHGSMGGEIQPQVFAEFVSAVVDGALDVASAVAIPRWAADVEEHYGAPSITRLEGRTERAVAEALVVRGHAVAFGEDFDSSFGHQHAIEFVWHGPSTGVDRVGADGGDGATSPGAPMSFAATADPRSEGLPAAY